MDETNVMLAKIAERVAEPGERAELVAAVASLREDTRSPDLGADILLLSAAVVQVGLIAVEVSRIVSAFMERKREDQILLVLARLAEKTGESVDGDATIKRVAEAAVEVITEHRSQKR